MYGTTLAELWNPKLMLDHLGRRVIVEDSMINFNTCIALSRVIMMLVDDLQLEEDDIYSSKLIMMQGT